MDTIITQPNTATSDPISQARQQILSAQRLVLASEGRTLDFETADEINRKLLASINTLSIITEPIDEDDTLTDEEMLELVDAEPGVGVRLRSRDLSVQNVDRQANGQERIHFPLPRTAFDFGAGFRRLATGAEPMRLPLA